MGRCVLCPQGRGKASRAPARLLFWGCIGLLSAWSKVVFLAWQLVLNILALLLSPYCILRLSCPPCTVSAAFFLACYRREEVWRWAVFHVGEPLAAAAASLGGRGGISPLLTWADFLPPNCSLCDSEYKVYYSGKPEVRDLWHFWTRSHAATKSIHVWKYLLNTSPLLQSAI